MLKCNRRTEIEMERDDQRGRPTVKYRGFPLPLPTLPTPVQCSDMQKIACHCDGNATWTCPNWTRTQGDPLDGCGRLLNGFLCSSLFEKLTVWPQLVCVCMSIYCYCYYCLLQLQFKRKIINILVAKATLPSPRSCFFRASACFASFLWPYRVTWWTGRG